ncbi:hypothetical protein ABMA28_002997 [Loxostege sticticalis]|uniref:Major facilitator superfamily (MFS) profile domain-containing protein n=1 Tax=Loxostege sticticalis TaxID=481309 RepID=A0ABD0SYR7_LOXSC
MASTENNSFGSQQNQESKTKATRVNVDSILIEELGQCGKFHIRTVLLLSLAGCLGAWATNEYVFTTARIPSRCHIPECDLDVPEFTPAWLLNAIPGVSLDSFDSCQRFANATAAPAHGEDMVYTVLSHSAAAWFDRGQVEKCDRHLYYNTDTIVYDFDLGCDEWRRSLVGSLVVAGLMVAMPITGFVSDRWGRRTALVFNATNTAWIGLLRYFCNSYIMFVMLEFAQNVFGAGAFSTAYIMDHYALSLTVYLVGTGCISATMTSINIYTAELFPTQYRHSLFAFCSMLGRMGSILAPLTPALGAAVWNNLPFALFAGCACAAGALVLLTPETRGVGFTDTMEEAEKIGKSKV